MSRWRSLGRRASHAAALRRGGYVRFSGHACHGPSFRGRTTRRATLRTCRHAPPLRSALTGGRTCRAAGCRTRARAARRTSTRAVVRDRRRRAPLYAVRRACWPPSARAVMVRPRTAAWHMLQVALRRSDQCRCALGSARGAHGAATALPRACLPPAAVAPPAACTVGLRALTSRGRSALRWRLADARRARPSRLAADQLAALSWPWHVLEATCRRRHA